MYMKFLLPILVLMQFSLIAVNVEARQVKTTKAYSVQPKRGGSPIIVEAGEHLKLEKCPKTSLSCVVKFKGETFNVPRSDLRLIRQAQRRVEPKSEEKITKSEISTTNKRTQTKNKVKKIAPSRLRDKDLNFGAATCSCVYETCRITSKFGPRPRPNSKASSYHEGMDIAGGAGTPIVAAESGSITLARSLSGYGKTIDIKHTDTYSTRYGHLSRFRKTSGWVQKGEIIGYMGSTGNVTGPHLHFEIIRNGEQINPAGLVSTKKSELSKQCSEVLAIGAASTAATAGAVE